jgi:hypothetical protein
MTRRQRKLQNDPTDHSGKALTLYVTETTCEEWAADSAPYTSVTAIGTAMFNIQKFYVLPTQCIYVFCYFTIQH